MAIACAPAREPGRAVETPATERDTSSVAAFQALTLTQGTSMAVAVSPDGESLAIDLQGTIWVLPATGGAARPVTDPFNDARQPVWSPDGTRIAFQGLRAGDYDIWTVDADGGGLRQVTEGPYDDREPAWSHDGTRIAFSSDRAGSYDIWTVDVATGRLQRITTNASTESMPTWSRDDMQIAYAATRGGASIIAATAISAARDDNPALPIGVERELGVRGDAPSWGPGGQLLYHVAQGTTSRLMLDGEPVTGAENASPFRASWASPTSFYYTADGGIRRRVLGDSVAQTIEFSARVTVTRAQYERCIRDVDSRAPRRALGIVAPQISPDGNSVAFAALGDIWVMRTDSAPRNMTRDAALDAEPTWSPDGSQLVYASDAGGGVVNLWLRDVRTGAARQLTRLTNAAMSPAWSPDGTRIAFLEVDAAWRRAGVALVDVATGVVTRIQDSTFGPGTPTWSPDGRYVAIAALRPYSARFREGTNQIQLIPTTPGGGEPRWLTVSANRGLDARVGAGPVWSPDGSKMAIVQDGALVILPVTPAGELNGPPRRMTTELAHAPSWSNDSRHLMYQHMDGLRVLDIERGVTFHLPVDLQYTPSIPDTRIVVHAGRLIDGRSPTLRTNVDVTIDGNRIVSVEPHRAALHNGRRVVDASGLTVMPGLIEHHTHLQKDFGEAHGRAWLAFGITTVRSPGSTPYEAVEDREAIDAGVRIGPRIFATGYLLEWQRAYYKMSVAVASDAHLEWELERARVLQHDMLKSYVRMPDLQQQRIVEFAHDMGVPASSHEIYPSALAGIDAVEHTGGTSRRGYSPKSTTLQRTYSDVTSIIGAAGMTLTPTFTLSSTWLQRLTAIETSLSGDARFQLLPQWLGRPWIARADSTAGTPPARPTDAGGAGEFMMAARAAGARIVAGTDTPNPANLHAELFAYVAAGMTPYEALQTATVNAAAALSLDAGTIEAGRLADLVAVAGNPLQDITHTSRVRFVIANGRVFDLAQLLAARAAGTR